MFQPFFSFPVLLIAASVTVTTADYLINRAYVDAACTKLAYNTVEKTACSPETANADGSAITTWQTITCMGPKAATVNTYSSATCSGAATAGTPPTIPSSSCIPPDPRIGGFYWVSTTCEVGTFTPLDSSAVANFYSPLRTCTPPGVADIKTLVPSFQAYYPLNECIVIPLNVSGRIVSGRIEWAAGSANLTISIYSSSTSCAGGSLATSINSACSLQVTSGGSPLVYVRVEVGNGGGGGSGTGAGSTCSGNIGCASGACRGGYCCASSSCTTSCDSVGYCTTSSTGAPITVFSCGFSDTCSPVGASCVASTVSTSGACTRGAGVLTIRGQDTAAQAWFTATPAAGIVVGYTVTLWTSPDCRGPAPSFTFPATSLSSPPLHSECRHESLGSLGTTLFLMAPTAAASFAVTTFPASNCSGEGASLSGLAAGCTNDASGQVSFAVTSYSGGAWMWRRSVVEGLKSDGVARLSAC